MKLGQNIFTRFFPSLYDFLCMCDWWRFPNTLECILPLLFAVLNIWLRPLKAFWKFYLCQLVIVSSRWVTILFAILIQNKIENRPFSHTAFNSTWTYISSFSFMNMSFVWQWTLGSLSVIRSAKPFFYTTEYYWIQDLIIIQHRNCPVS